MDFFKVVEKRKVIRAYIAGKKIPGKDIRKILETVSLAPSAKNLQSYKIFVVSSTADITEIYNSCYNQRSDFIRNAALILVFCKDPTRAEEIFGPRGKNLYSLQDATIAATYAILTATALGYKTSWVGNFKEEEVKKVLKTSLTPVATIIIGYSKEEPERKTRKPISIIAEFV